MTTALADSIQKDIQKDGDVYKLRIEYPELLEQIRNNRDHKRWDAIKSLKQYGYNIEDISLACDFAANNLYMWRMRNRDEYEGRPSGRRQQPQHVETDVTIADNPDYGTLPPTGFVSNLDHYAWGRKYAPAFSEWDRLDYLEDMQNRIWDTLKLMVQTARDHGKTWTMIKLFARWLLEKGTKVIVVATQAKKDEIYQAVLDILKSTEIREDYGDVVDRHTLTKGEIWFVDDLRPAVGANFTIKGSDSFVTGLHADGGWLHLEDIVQEIKVDSSAEKRVRHWFKRTVRYIRGNDTKLTLTATRKGIDDFYNFLEVEHHFDGRLLYKQEALVIESGRLPTVDEITYDPEREIVLDYPDVGVYRTLGCPNYPLERLLFEFIFHTADANAELNNNPLPLEGSYFNISDFSLIRPHDYEYDKYIMVDPAFGQSGSKTAILVLMVKGSKLIVVDAYVGFASVDDKINLILDFYSRHNPARVYVENNFNQFTRELSSHNPLTNLRGLYPFNSVDSSKKQRIAHLEFPFKKHEIEFYETCPFLNDIKAEYLTFSLSDGNSTIREKYNALDALAMGYKKLKHFLDNPEQSEDDEAETWGVW